LSLGLSICKTALHAGSSDEVMDTCGGDSTNDTNGTGREKSAGATQRSNTTVHVCWHRNTSISMRDQLRAVEVSTSYMFC
jgi:FERM/RhoGEF/pleckstrin domain protein 2